ncbi:hypothetical protein RRG08_010011 [Elysia crispata]|uniref:Uncharacterized protein n=1 Tax=Elysia crispata TaxID=231223 RepID=A0AAE1D2E8_9GAST|nr:hypothetical protein RRG08_010011 [Elysia crispata]
MFIFFTLPLTKRLGNPIFPHSPVVQRPKSESHEKRIAKPLRRRSWLQPVYFRCARLRHSLRTRIVACLVSCSGPPSPQRMFTICWRFQQSWRRGSRTWCVGETGENSSRLTQ